MILLDVIAQSVIIEVTICRYDWMRDEPKDWRSQDCLTFLKDQDIFGYGVWHWNDWDCDRTAGYICERDGNVNNGNEEETTVVY